MKIENNTKENIHFPNKSGEQFNFQKNLPKFIHILDVSYRVLDSRVACE